MKRALVGAAALGVAAIAAVFIWFNVIRDDAPDAFELTEETAESESGGSSDDTASDGSSNDSSGDTASGDAASADGDVSGTWTVGEGSEAGYRVVEDLGSVQDFEAVGRTGDVTGTVDIDGTTVTAASFEVQIDTITSDDGRRDGAFSGQVMNAAEFPTAAFTLTDPIEIGSVPAGGEAVTTAAAGELTLRGETNAVGVDVQSQQIDGRIEIVASIPVLFSDYGIANPSNPLVSVRDEGLVEVRLLLDR